MLNKLKVLCLTLILLVFSTSPGFAQNQPDLFIRIERLVSEKHPSWKLTKRRVYRNNKYRLYSWEKGKSFLDVFLFVDESSEQALTRFKTLSSDLRDIGIDMTVLKATIAGLGNENYLWEGSRNERVLGIDFRKGKLVVHIGASSIAIAEEFALQIADEIPAN
jgi:hypothetical protein